LGPAILYLFAGGSLGCLAGAKWMELIGTRSMVAARIVCCLVVAAGLIVMSGVAALRIHVCSRP